MSDFEKHLNKAISFLSRRPRSEKEVRDNLLKKKAPPEVVDQIISWLKERKFLNDEEFARWWIEQRARFRPKGQRMIRIELKQKGITEDVINAAITNQESSQSEGLDEQTGISNDEEMARKLVEKKISKYKHLPKQEIYQKLGAFLARRGFDWETIKKTIDIILNEK